MHSPLSVHFARIEVLGRIIYLSAMLEVSCAVRMFRIFVKCLLLLWCVGVHVLFLSVFRKTLGSFGKDSL